ncbi:oxoglutarate/iron-dependent dioxygenase [Artemisia annua]|uniref:Oxoglutarate/iron-dependent dioxygenase n=1 Tax=Artemisia annua TaxID=35608 RepID=A0A2U1LD09_ARTAN|nr:oxoglutarate/iron-dependent dioxygenase [Artemisia annua]
MNFRNSFILFRLCLNILSPDFTLLSSGIPDIRTSVIRLPNGDSYGHPFDPSRVIRISWHPRAFLYKKFLTDEECDHLIKVAKDKLEKSMVADVKTGKSIESTVRTSKGMIIRKAQDEVVGRIESRISVWTFLPVENGEAIQVLHYENGQKYLPHWDYFQDKPNQALGGHRIVTVLMYLSNVEKGGETIFPESEEDQGHWLNGVAFEDSLANKHIAYLKDEQKDEIILSAGMADNPMSTLFIPSPIAVNPSGVQIVGITGSGSYIETMGGFIAEKVNGPLSMGELKIKNRNPYDNP